MCKLTTTEVARLDTGIYEDLVDHEYRYYGVPGEAYGPLNFKYASEGGTEVLRHVRREARRAADRKGQVLWNGDSERGASPLRLRISGSMPNVNAQGIYTLMLVRAEDGAVLASVDLDTSQGHADAMGFKYAALDTPLRLDARPASP